MTTTEPLTAEQGAALLGHPQPVRRAPKPANRPIHTSRDIEAEVEQRFRTDTAGHELRILHDDGLYRHLLVRNPRSSMYWYEILTWPGSLSIRGDMGSGYVFSRERDMFPFFRSERGRINAHYWSEKLSSGRDSVREYSEHVVRQRIVEAFLEDVRWNGAPRGLGEALRAGILNRDLYFEDEARGLLENFEFKGYSFDDLWEWDLRDFDPAFLWCCHAIVAGIAQYDRAAKPPPRLRTAWESARRGRAQLRARVAELEAADPNDSIVRFSANEIARWQAQQQHAHNTAPGGTK